MRPLDSLTSIKVKLGVVILVAVAVTATVGVLGVRAGFSPLACGVAASLIALAMVPVLARGMTSPLREMAAASRAMARGEYGLRVTASSRDEVGELARAFNAMAADLAEMDRERRDLVANVSHELRTPIGALQAVLENLADGVDDADSETIQTMLVQVRRLGRLVAQLLDLSRLESGGLRIERRPFELRALLEQAADESRLHARQLEKAQLHVSVSVEPEELSTEGDPERMHQVLANLLENAVRHSPSDGEVTLLARPDGDHRGVEIVVADQGPGIPAEEAPRVFERFYRADAARAASDGGSGLGLSIARWIVELHEGRIRVEPGEPHGCRMVVSLPGAGR